VSGPLGAGKTMFVKGVCAALGIDAEEVTSPSFTLVNPHSDVCCSITSTSTASMKVASAAHAVDLDELLVMKEPVIVIEWAERMGGISPAGNSVAYCHPR